MDNLPDLILTVTDYLRAWGFELPEEVKQRDEREPGRRQKIRFENKFYRATKAYFKRLAEKAQRRLELHEIFYPRKAIDLDSYIGTDFFDDEEFDADVIRLLLQGVGEGTALFSEEIGIPLDYSGINKKVLAWAKRQSGQIVKTVDKTSRELIKQAVSLFVETPGFTIGDIMNMLPFDDTRALRIAVTGDQGTGERHCGRGEAGRRVNRYGHTDEYPIRQRCQLCHLAAGRAELYYQDSHT